MMSDENENSDARTDLPGPEAHLPSEYRYEPSRLYALASKPRRPVALVYLAALAGGVVGIPAAVMHELQAGLPLWLTAVLVAPLVEEVLKPIGVMFVMEKRFGWLSGPKQIIVMAVLGALMFATLENIMYIYWANPEGGMGYILWRYIVCTLMHVSASIIFGIGLAKMWLRMKREGTRFRIKGLMRYYILASVLHGLYNATVMILEKAGVLTFD